MNFPNNILHIILFFVVIPHAITALNGILCRACLTVAVQPQLQRQCLRCKLNCQSVGGLSEWKHYVVVCKRERERIKQLTVQFQSVNFIVICLKAYQSNIF